MELSSKDLARFWAKVHQTDSCWLWTAGTDIGGYGVFRVGKKKAHVVSWFIHHSSKDGELNVLHNCDNPPCVNPHHLELNTQQKNIQDMYDRGRANNPRGERHGRAKLKTKDVEEIKALYLSGKYLQKELSFRFGVSQKSISNIVLGKKWGHL